MSECCKQAAETKLKYTLLDLRDFFQKLIEMWTLERIRHRLKHLPKLRSAQK